MLKYSFTLAQFTLVTILVLLPAFKIKSQYLSVEKQSYYKEAATKIIRFSLTEKQGYEWLRELCKIGPRLSGSENFMHAARWAEEKMRSLGLKVWLQPVMVPRWVRGKTEEATIVNPDKHTGRKLNVMALGGSIATGENGITAKVIEIKNFDDLEARRDEVKGKIVFFNRPMDEGLVNTFSAYGSAVDQRISGAIHAARFGALGVIVRSVTSKRDNTPHTGLVRYEDDTPAIPAVSIGIPDADFLSELLAMLTKLEINLKLDCETLPDVLSYNLIADLIGSEKAEEIVIVAGHFDSWDAGCGAHDDGAGCMQALETLDLFNRLELKPKRTIRCIFYTNEENGFHGAIEYANYADTVSYEKHIAAIESDRGVFTPRGFLVDADSATILYMQKFVPFTEMARAEWIKKGGSGPDISFIKNAKALIAFYPDDQRYFDVHHSANDLFEEVHPREMQLGTAAIAILTFLLSEEF